jgi:pimeloyl-ACP methyl ester carboxylesterase
MMFARLGGDTVTRELLPLVLIHGYPLDHSMWFGVIAALGAGVRTIAPDLRGFGKAGRPQDEPSLDTMAQDVISLLDRENIPRAVIAGMSMGGYVALALAEMAREKVAGLALVNSQCYADTEEARDGRRETIRKVRAEGPSVAANAVIPKMFAPALVNNPDFQRFPIAGAEAAGVEGICWALEAMARRPDRCHVISEAAFPTLVLHGTEDKFIPVEKARRMTELNPATHFVSIKGAGHGAAMEAPDEVATYLRRFVELCSNPPQSAEGSETATQTITETKTS